MVTLSAAKRPSLGPLLVVLALACASGDTSRAGGAAGLATAIDSTADSVIARTDGEVPAAALRGLTEELRIAPAADDTSLFTELFEFDVTPAGSIWAYDTQAKSLFLFGPDGRLRHRVGRDGAGPGELRSSSGMITLGDSGLVLWDPQNARISFFDSSGTFRTSWPTPGGFSSSNGLVTDRSGALFVRRPVTGAREGEILGRMGLVRLRPGGAFADSLAPPDLDVARDVYVAEINLKGNQSRSSTASNFAASYVWAWHPDGYFVVADGGKYEITLARSGKPVVIRRSAALVPIDAAERDEERERITYSMRQTQPDWIWKGPALPEAKAPLRSVFLSRDGRVWAQVSVPSERIPDAELTTYTDPKRPVTHFRTPLVYEVFHSDGRFLGRVAFPPRSRLIEADGNAVWVLGRNEDDLPAILRLRIAPGIE